MTGALLLAGVCRADQAAMPVAVAACIVQAAAEARPEVAAFLRMAGDPDDVPTPPANIPVGQFLEGLKAGAYE